MIIFDQQSGIAGRKAVLWLLPFAFIYGVMSALRWPLIYSTSYMVIDYHFGFGKRGLIGAILAMIDRRPYHYVTLAYMAFVVFALWLALLGAAAWRSLKNDAGIAVAFLLFFLSAGFASLVCDVGRGEQFGLLLSMPCLLLPVRMRWLPLRAALLVAAVLMHEANFLIIVPVVAFDVATGISSSSRRRALCMAGTILPAAVLTWYLGNVRTACDHATAMAYFEHMVVTFSTASSSVSALCLDGHQNRVAAMVFLWSSPGLVAAVPLALIVALPSTFFNLLLAARILRFRLSQIAAGTTATVAPIALLAVGADTVRFITLIQITSLLVLVSAVRRVGLPDAGTLSPALRQVAVMSALTAFELGSSLTLTDGNAMLKFPFMPLVQRAVAIAEGKAPFVVIPRL